jgi:type IV pilus assembly protein PilC
MTTYSYAALDAQGRETTGTLEVENQAEALKRIKEMGFYPVTITEQRKASSPAARAQRHAGRLKLTSRANTTTAPKARGRVKGKQITLFTRQLATLVEAGLPLLRGLRLLHEQEEGRNFKAVLVDLMSAIESGSSFSEALAQHPRVFDRLFLNMVKAGEIAGALELSLARLAEFREKAARIRGKVKAAMFYPAAVVTVALGVLTLMMVYIVPRFQEVLTGLMNGKPLPAFTRFVMGVSETIQHSFLWIVVAGAALFALFRMAVATRGGRLWFDGFKLRMPVLGPVFRKLAIARFTRTLGTLITSGVPILQALNIIKDATGNAVVGRLAGRVHDNVEQGESITQPLRESRIFPAMVVGMVDVGEQTGALPEMLNKVADNYDEEVDNSVSAMTSLLEPIMIVFLGVVVGAIVVAMFWPIIQAATETGISGPGE